MNFNSLQFVKGEINPIEFFEKFELHFSSVNNSKKKIELYRFIPCQDQANYSKLILNNDYGFIKKKFIEDYLTPYLKKRYNKLKIKQEKKDLKTFIELKYLALKKFSSQNENQIVESILFDLEPEISKYFYVNASHKSYKELIDLSIILDKSGLLNNRDLTSKTEVCSQNTIEYKLGEEVSLTILKDQNKSDQTKNNEKNQEKKVKVKDIDGNQIKESIEKDKDNKKNIKDDIFSVPKDFKKTFENSAKPSFPIIQGFNFANIKN